MRVFPAYNSNYYLSHVSSSWVLKKDHTFQYLAQPTRAPAPFCTICTTLEHKPASSDKKTGQQTTYARALLCKLCNFRAWTNCSDKETTSLDQLRWSRKFNTPKAPADSLWLSPLNLVTFANSKRWSKKFTTPQFFHDQFFLTWPNLTLWFL